MKKRAVKTYKHKGHPLYPRWLKMRRRCNDKNCMEYCYYGAKCLNTLLRGIRVCEEWDNFKVFVKDMSSTFKRELWLDRVDNNKGYFKDNCRWASPKEQQSNRRNNHFIEYKGIRDTISNWARFVGLSQPTLSKRINKGLPVERALYG